MKTNFLKIYAAGKVLPAAYILYGFFYFIKIINVWSYLCILQIFCSNYFGHLNVDPIHSFLNICTWIWSVASSSRIICCSLSCRKNLWYLIEIFIALYTTWRVQRSMRILTLLCILHNILCNVYFVLESISYR